MKRFPSPRCAQSLISNALRTAHSTAGDTPEEFDKKRTQHSKSCSMKFTRPRIFSFSLLTVICCCTAIFASIAAAPRQGLFGWFQVSPTNSPPARSYLAMAYDPVSGKIIMFGGYDENGYLNDTWEFDRDYLDTSRDQHPDLQSALPAKRHMILPLRSWYFTGDLMEQLAWEIPGYGMETTPQVDTGHTCASASGRYRSDVVPRSKWPGRLFWRIRWAVLPADDVAMERFRLDAIVSTNSPVCSGSAAVATNTVTGQVVMFGGLADRQSDQHLDV